MSRREHPLRLTIQEEEALATVVVWALENGAQEVLAADPVRAEAFASFTTKIRKRADRLAARHGWLV